jgi:hypothetical protein
MNLYKLHSYPEELDFYDAAHEKIPFVFWEKYKDNPAELKKRENIIAKNAEYSCFYAENVLKAPFPKGEAAIAKDRYYADEYIKRHQGSGVKIDNV